MKLLLVEDDNRISDYLLQVLSAESYSCTRCANLSELESFLINVNAEADLVILDRMLGREDGANYLKKIKSRFKDCAVLILSSLDIPSEKAKVIDLGADDYLAKPFSLEELLARLRLLARRARPSGPSDSLATIRNFGDLSINLLTNEIRCKSKRLDLTKKEYQLLLLLIESPGRVFNKAQILDRVWDIHANVESNVVESTIKNLRRKIDEARSDVRIESKRNFGYWIET